jgi:hypothetical protein
MAGYTTLYKSATPWQVPAIVLTTEGHKNYAGRFITSAADVDVRWHNVLIFTPVYKRLLSLAGSYHPLGQG